MFITIDGGEGAGKSTQIKFLRDRFIEAGFDVATFRDPGSTLLGEAIRHILLNRSEMVIHDRSEMLLFMAARAQMIEELIQPALDKDQVVLVDRFLLSTIVYQGFAAERDVESIWEIGKIVLGDCVPDLCIVLDIDPKEGFNRINRPLDRMESKGIEYHSRVCEGFREATLQWAHYFDSSSELISAGGSPEEVCDRIAQIVCIEPTE